MPIKPDIVLAGEALASLAGYFSKPTAVDPLQPFAWADSDDRLCPIPGVRWLGRMARSVKNRFHDEMARRANGITIAVTAALRRGRSTWS